MLMESMKIKIICVGKTKQNFIESGITEYQKRLHSFTNIEIVNLSDIKLSSSNNVEIVKKKEAAIISKYLDKQNFNIALDENGKSLSSLQFADLFQAQMNTGKNLCFFIGGVYGFEKELLKNYDLKLSFSSFTFTHQMIRLILFEQIYRAFTIINGKKYHY